MAMDKERPNPIAGLIDKRRELAGRFEHVQRELRPISAPGPGSGRLQASLRFGAFFGVAGWQEAGQRVPEGHCRAGRRVEAAVR
jgi:hypothetical protein